MSRPTVITRIFDPGTIEESRLIYVVIGAWTSDQWIFVRHRDRLTWEMPAGHIEPGESADRAAVRELFEEAGVTKSFLEHICDYSVRVNELTEFGRLYGARVHDLDPNLVYETEELMYARQLPGKLTYPEVQTILFGQLRDHYTSSP